MPFRVLVFSFVFSVCSAQSSSSISLREAVRLSLSRSPDYLTAVNDLEIARLGERNAWAGYFPSLDLSASHGVRGVDPDSAGLTSTTNAVSGTTLSLSENLYDNGETFKKHQIADLQMQIARNNFDKVRGKTVLNTVVAYYQYQVSIQELDFKRRSFAELERLSNLASNQFHQGLKLRKDFLRFKTQAERARLSVFDAEAAVTTARAELFSAIGMSPDAGVKFDETFSPVLPKNAINGDFGSEALYEAKIFFLQKQITDYEIDLARRKLWPELNLVGAASYGSSSYIGTGKSWTDNDVGQWSVLLNLKFNILDWGVRSRNIQIAAVTQNSTEQRYRSALLVAEEDLANFKSDVVRLKETRQIAKDLLKMEEDTYKMMERDYRTGQASSLELSTELANLLDAQAQGVSSDFKEANLYLRWKYFKGVLNEETVFE